MVDTARTLVQMKALLADNVSGEISPQDVRDLVESIVNPVVGGGLDEIYTRIAEPRHVAIGEGAQVDIAQASVEVNLPDASIIANFEERYSGEAGDLFAGIVANAEYDRAVPFTGGKPPSIYGALIHASWRADDAATGQSGPTPTLMGIHGAAVLYEEGTLTPPQGVTGIFGNVTLEEGTTTQFGSTGVDANVAALGTTPGDPGDLNGLIASAYSFRTGAYVMRSIWATHWDAGGDPDELYGVLIDPHLHGTVESWNLVSLGATSKNKLEGSLTMGRQITGPGYTLGQAGGATNVTALYFLGYYLDGASAALRVRNNNGSLGADIVQLGGNSTGALFRAPQASGRTLKLEAVAGQSGVLLDALASDGSTSLFSLDPAGIPRWVAPANQQTTVGAAGGASALPATPTKYLKVKDSDGTTLIIPAYAAT